MTAMDIAVPPFYLFLDFDGVLHPVGQGVNPFEHADRLGAALRAFPEVRVVVSSSWRELYPLDALRGMCGLVLGSRVIGATPVFRRCTRREKPRLRLRVGGHAPLLRFAIDPIASRFFERFEEISAWLALYAPAPSQANRNAADRDDWIALDDSDFWFPAACPQLIHVADGLGLDDAHFACLEALLLARRQAMT